MAKQTAVQWLKTEMEQYGDSEYLIIRWTDLDELINQAKQMEKEQIKQSWFDSTLQFDNAASMVDKKEFEQYYNETFGKQ